jgi:HEAT repeat protein
MRTLWIIGLSLTAFCLGDPSYAQAPPEELARHLKALKGGNKEARADAAIARGNYGAAAAEAAPALAATMRQDIDVNVANHASRALAKIGRHAVPELIQSFKDRDHNVRYRAAWALHSIGPDGEEAVPALIKALHDDHEQVRTWSAYALGEIGPQARDAAMDLVKLLRDPKANLRQQASSALQKIGEHAVPALIEALREQQARGREEVAYALRLLGPVAKGAVPALVDAINDKNAKVRVQALAALAAIGKEAKEALPALIEALQVKHYDTQVQALRAVLSIGSRDEPGLLERLREVNRKVTWAVPYVLAQFGPKTRDAIPPLLKSLKDQDAQIRFIAALALGQIGPEGKQAVPELEMALKDPSAEVRTAAAVSLSNLDEARQKAAIESLDLALLRARRAMIAAQQRLQLAQQGRLLGQRMLEELPQLDTLLRQENPLAVRLVLGPVNKAAFTNPELQHQFSQVLFTYLSTTSEKCHCHSLGFIGMQVAELIGQMGPEAVPALVNSVNYAASFAIGFS